MHPVLAAPPLHRHHLTPLEISLYGRQKTHVHLLPRDFRPKRALWITTCFRTTSSERKPYRIKPGVNIVATSIDRTIDIQSA